VGRVVLGRLRGKAVRGGEKCERHEVSSSLVSKGRGRGDSSSQNLTWRKTSWKDFLEEKGDPKGGRSSIRA